MNLNQKIKIFLILLLIILIFVFLYFYNLNFNNKKTITPQNITKEVIKASILRDSNLIKKTITSKEAYSLSNLDNSLKFLIPLNFISLNLEKLVYENDASGFHINYFFNGNDLENYYFDMISNFTQRNWKMINSKSRNDFAFIEAQNNNYLVDFLIEKGENNNGIVVDIYVLNKNK
jgi:hypothetical protein